MDTITPFQAALGERVPEPHIQHLNALLRVEISAVETVSQVIAMFDIEAPFELSGCQRSHELRVEKLTIHVADLGGLPATGSGLRGSFALLREGSAALLGHQSALASLEEGEEHGLACYRERLADPGLDAESRRLIEAELLPEQLKTHDTVCDLRRTCT